MQAFLDDLERSGAKHHPEKFSDFRKTLEEVAQHPNHRYFVLKSIIINNLYGVDIMEEAVEICKLRLFLKLVAQVDKAKQVEPLPDIDFNIRPGNTLVGFTDMEQIEKSFKRDAEGYGRLAQDDDEAQMNRIREDAEVTARAYRMFRKMQTEYGMEAKKFTQSKLELRTRLDKLRAELDRYLAGEYGVKLDKPKEFEQWQKSHQPFHWLAEFYGIMHDGGFDVIIGNPPYVEIKNIKHYTLVGYQTEECGDLYSFVMERSESLAKPIGKMGMIVPVSISSTDGFDALRKILLKSERVSWCLGFAERPSKLFTGVEKRLAIWVGTGSGSGPDRSLYLSNYRRWLGEEREALFQTTRLTEKGTIKDLVGSSLPKIALPIERDILLKLGNDNALKNQFLKHSVYHIYYTRKVRYFVQFFDFVPEIHDSNGKLVDPSELKTFGVPTAVGRDVGIAVLNSGLFFWFFSVYSDVRNLNRREIEAFPCSLDKIDRHDSVLRP